MATEPSGTEYVPQLCVDGVSPRDIISDARDAGLVIECTGASGVTHSFIHNGVMDLWAATRDELDSAWLVDPSVEETIENCIRRCDPDVRLVKESISAFGDGGSDA